MDQSSFDLSIYFELITTEKLSDSIFQVFWKRANNLHFLAFKRLSQGFQARETDAWHHTSSTIMLTVQALVGCMNCEHELSAYLRW